MPPIKEPQFDVLPPDRSAKGDAIARLIAHLMDNLLRVPGTKARVGLNPFLDLIPLFGDGAAMLVTASMLLEAARRGVPKSVMARMGANVLLNGLMGTIPGVGEAFAFWFRPSTRNYALLQKHGSSSAVPPKSHAKDWAFVIALIVFVILAIGALAALSFYVVWRLLHAIGG